MKKHTIIKKEVIMKFSKLSKTAFLLFIIVACISCSPKGVFLPIETESPYSKPYPIYLTDKQPFEKAFYRSDKEFNRLMMSTLSLFDYQFVPQNKASKLSSEAMQKKENKKYIIVSCDDKYIYSGIIKEKDSALYAKFNPITNNDESLTLKTKNINKLYYWVMQEMNKEAVISIIAEKKVYYAKSFSSL